MRWSTISGANGTIYNNSSNGFTSITWKKISGFIPLNYYTPKVTTFTTSGTWTPASGMKYAIAELVGCGGGGGGAVASNSGTCALSSSGGAGAYLKVKYEAGQLSASHTIGIGSAGAGGGITGAAGGGGGNAIITGLSSCSGGAGGAGETIYAVTSEQVGGAGGVVTETLGTRIALIAGQQGGSSAGYGTVGASYVGIGAGGATPLGLPACAVNGVSSTTLSSADGTGYGYGGRGVGGANSSARAGGAGGPGLIIITEYF
jgi:hypothetical protein